MGKGQESGMEGEGNRKDTRVGSCHTSTTQAVGLFKLFQLSFQLLLLPDQPLFSLLEALAVEGCLLQDLYFGGFLQNHGIRNKLAEVLEGIPQVHSSLSLKGVVHRSPPLIIIPLVPPAVLGGLDNLQKRGYIQEYVLCGLILILGCQNPSAESPYAVSYLF